MPQTTARIKKTGKPFEIIVDMELALKHKRGESKNVDFLEINKIFSDAKKGLHAPEKDLMEAFKTKDVNEIASRIVREGEILVTQKHRSAEQEQKIKQVIDFLSRNSIDPHTGRPHTPERIKSAINESGINIKNLPIEQQINEIIEKLSEIIPIKLEMKKIKIVVPAIYTGRVYGIVSQYKESEDWRNNGDLEIIIKIPSGLIMEFYDKLNSITYGSAIAEEMKE